MSRLLFWIPDSLMIIAIVAIGLGVVIGAIRPKRALSLLGLIVLILISGPFVDALLGAIWRALPLWFILCSLPFVALWLARSLFRLVLGRTATDHMTGILAAQGVTSIGRGVSRVIALPIRAIRGRL